MNGHVGHLTAEQEKTLKEFKELVSDIHRPDFDDYFYLRWLRARNFDKGKSETMLRKNQIWRKKIGADTMVSDYKPPEVLEKFYPRGLIGTDKEGCPVRYLPFRNLDFRGLTMSLPKTEIVKFLTYCYEQETEMMKTQSKKLGKVIERSTYILDIDGYTLRQATNRQSVDTLNTLLRVFEANYPERLKIAYFINAPVFFSMVLALSSPFLSEATLNKFKVFGKDDDKAFLPTVIDADVLPAFLGGNRKDPDGDPACKSIINYGSFIPKAYYFARAGHFSEEPGVEGVSLERRSFHLVDVEIREPGSKLLWEVETTNRDLGIGLFYRNNSNELELVLPVDRVDCHLVRESGLHICSKPGVYVLKFDNSFSLFHTKKVYFKITVSTDDEIEDL